MRQAFLPPSLLLLIPLPPSLTPIRHRALRRSVVVGAMAHIQGVVVASALIGQLQETDPIVCAAPDAELHVDDIVHPRPLVPGEAAPKADCCRGAGESVGGADHFVPGCPELELGETAMAAGERVALQQQGAFEELGMVRRQPIQFPNL